MILSVPCALQGGALAVPPATESAFTIELKRAELTVQ